MNQSTGLNISRSAQLGRDDSVARQHMIWILQPLTTEYSKNTSIGILLSNPQWAEPGSYLDGSLADYLKQCGFERIYVLFLVTRIGDPLSIQHYSGPDLVRNRWEAAVGEIVADIGSLLVAYGDPANDLYGLKRTVQLKRFAEISANINPHLKIFRLGELSTQGNPCLSRGDYSNLQLVSHNMNEPGA